MGNLSGGVYAELMARVEEAGRNVQHAGLMAVIRWKDIFGSLEPRWTRVARGP